MIVIFGCSVIRINSASRIDTAENASADSRIHDMTSLVAKKGAHLMRRTTSSTNTSKTKGRKVLYQHTEPFRLLTSSFLITLQYVCKEHSWISIQNSFSSNTIYFSQIGHKPCDL